MGAEQTWGLAATILAPAPEILRFAAYHLQAGAHRLYIYLDDENPEAYEALRAHPKVRITQCDAEWWAQKVNGRPGKHQARQTYNATHAYRCRAEVDWLIHMDVDEFLISNQPIESFVSSISNSTPCARARPMELLSGSASAFKKFIPPGPARETLVKEIYPTFGPHIKGGFLSHLAGKVLVRTGQPDIEIRIHNAFQNGTELKGMDMHQDILALAHCHAKSWPAWLAAYRYRLTKGSYRAELAPNKPREKGGLSMHELFEMIEKNEGEAGLRRFFDEVCADTPDLRARLERHGMLRLVNLDLDAAVSAQFPNASL